MIELDVPPITETAVLARLVLPDEDPAEVEESISEAKRLAWTAGAAVAATLVQRRSAPCPATLLGKGKADQLKALCEEVEADIVLFDSELSPAQGSNLEKALGCKVVDRTQLILDIFAQRARTNEGKHQVELAQLQYLLPRLSGRGSIMRQQGGIGVRGPGEQKLEVDRRVIRRRIQMLEEELDAIRRTRRVQRKRRAETGVPAVALVGYTNAGKSSLLNALTGAGAFVEDKLFATLDPTTRRKRLPSGREVIISDTVGFVRHLPHALVAAFRATLEEVNDADLLLLVVDSADPAMEEHILAVKSVLEEIEAGDKPVLMVFNKIDTMEPGAVAALLAGRDQTVAISAQRGDHLDQLLQTVDTLLAEARHRLRLRLPQSEAALAARIRRHGRILHESYEGNDILLEAEVDPSLAGAVAPYAM